LNIVLFNDSVPINVLIEFQRSLRLKINNKARRKKKGRLFSSRDRPACEITVSGRSLTRC